MFCILEVYFKDTDTSKEITASKSDTNIYVSNLAKLVQGILG